jgi:hypothetical protein
MIYKEVVPAFDMLLEELERIIPDLNDQGKQLLDQKQYTQAHELINKAQAVVDFQVKVQALKEEWLKMQVPSTKASRPTKPKPTPKHISRNPGEKLAVGLRTKNSELHMPILRALVNRGGRMQYADLIVILKHYLKDKLNEYDLALLPDGKTVRWENNVGWAKKPLLDLGYLSGTAPVGTWEITLAGRKALGDYEKQQASE